jgi:hypothetical protein
MTTLKSTADDTTWVDIITDLSLTNDLTYTVQNVSSGTALMTEQATTPDDDSAIHYILPKQSMIIIVDDSIGIYVKGLSSDITVSVTESE